MTDMLYNQQRKYLLNKIIHDLLTDDQLDFEPRIMYKDIYGNVYPTLRDYLIKLDLVV